MSDSHQVKSNQQRNEGYSDLRDLIERFEEMGEIEKVNGADWNLEVAAVAETVAAQDPGRAPALLFDNIEGYPEGFRILAGGANGLRRLAVVMDLPDPETEMDLVRSMRRRMRTKFEPIPPLKVSTGPVMENIDRGSDINMWKFPVPFVHELDGGRYIGTDDLVIMRDPDTGWVNCGTYRTMVHDETNVAVWMSPGKHGRLISDKYFKRGEDCPVLISCGQDPLLFISAHQEIDPEVDELAYAGGQRGRAIEYIPSEVHGLPIPAQSEVVIEGTMSRTEIREEGPFGEFMGYYASNASELPVIKVERVYYRTNPILTLAVPSRPPENFTFARATVKSALIWDEMEKAGIPGVKGVWCHEAGAGRLFNVVAIEQLYPGHASQAAMVATNCHAGNYAGRWVVVVDEDIDPSNIFDVVWAMSTRCDPPEDVQFIKRAWSTPLDPLLREPPWQNNRGIIDACRPYGWKDEFPKVAEASPDLKAKIRAKFPQLYK